MSKKKKKRRKTVKLVPVDLDINRLLKLPTIKYDKINCEVFEEGIRHNGYKNDIRENPSLRRSDEKREKRKRFSKSKANWRNFHSRKKKGKKIWGHNEVTVFERKILSIRT